MLGERRNAKVPVDPETALQLLLDARDARAVANPPHTPPQLDPESAFQRLLAELAGGANGVTTTTAGD